MSPSHHALPESMLAMLFFMLAACSAQDQILADVVGFSLMQKSAQLKSEMPPNISLGASLLERTAVQNDLVQAHSKSRKKQSPNDKAKDEAKAGDDNTIEKTEDEAGTSEDKTEDKADKPEDTAEDKGDKSDEDKVGSKGDEAGGEAEKADEDSAEDQAKPEDDKAEVGKAEDEAKQNDDTADSKVEENFRDTSEKEDGDKVDGQTAKLEPKVQETETMQAGIAAEDSEREQGEEVASEAERGEAAESKTSEGNYVILIIVSIFFFIHVLFSFVVHDTQILHHKHQGGVSENLSEHFDKDASPSRVGIAQFLESYSFKWLVIVLILIDVMISVGILYLECAEAAREGHEAAMLWLEARSINLLTFFLVENMMYAICFGRMYWSHKWHVFDLAVVYVTFIGDTVFKEQFTGSLEFVIALRLWRVVSAVWGVCLGKHERAEMAEKGEEEPGKQRTSAQSSQLPRGALPPSWSTGEVAKFQDQQRNFTDENQLESARTYGLEGIGRNAPVLFLPWMFFAMCLFGLGLMCEMMICFLILTFCLGMTLVFFILSRGRGAAWSFYCLLCLFSTLGGTAIGYMHRVRGGDRLLTRGEVIFCCFLVTCYLLVMLTLSVVMSRFGIRLVGSSAAFAREKGWGYNPQMLSHLHFGIDRNFDTGADLVEAGVHPKAVAIGLLQHRCYWTGEPVMDYVFFMCNESSFLSAILSHPVNPFGFGERWLALAMIIPLILFPVALIDTLYPEACPQKVVLNFSVFIFPRYLLKMYIKELCTLSDQIQLKTSSGDLEEDSPLANLSLFADLKDLRTAARPKDALRREFVFFCIIGNCTVCLSCCISMYVYAKTAALSMALWSACEGLVYAFVLELILQIIVPHKQSDGTWVVGFFGHWWAERLKPEFGGKQAAPSRSALAGAPLMNDPMQMW